MDRFVDIYGRFGLVQLQPIGARTKKCWKNMKTGTAAHAFICCRFSSQWVRFLLIKRIGSTKIRSYASLVYTVVANPVILCSISIEKLKLVRVLIQQRNNTVYWWIIQNKNLLWKTSAVFCMVTPLRKICFSRIGILDVLLPTLVTQLSVK